ncbi:MAG: class I SAM-dependent methyltransferase [Acidobacteriota bacterium]|nr:class I SAM-dependent methyltransferase [Acidobacteriota bacterium]
MNAAFGALGEMLNPQAQLFDCYADAYAQFRPSYPDAAIEMMLERWQLGPHALVCDLAAGTGTLGGMFAARGFQVVAVEPLAQMRNCLARIAHQRRWPIQVVGGLAEAIPLRDQSVHAMVCGQAFHWFQADAALSEMHRVLKPGGGMALLWNNQDWRHVAWLAELERLIEHYNPQYDRHYRSKDWQSVVNRSGLFAPVQTFEFVMDLFPTTEQVLGLVSTYSYVRSMPPERQRPLLDEIAAVCEREQQVGGVLLLRYRTQLYLTQRPRR